MSINQTTYKEDVKRFRELIADIKIALLTTVTENGNLQSRPMATQEQEFDGDLWFFTGNDSDKVKEIRARPQVGLSYAAPDKNRFVSVSGYAEIVDDRAKMEELWNPLFKIWFPEGMDDPTLRLIKVDVISAEYWDAPSNKVVTLAGLVKSLTTGGSPEKLGENEELRLKQSRPEPVKAETGKLG